ncbi:MAG: hypothetical protein AAGM22_31980 [Acidobacteriota bacterium]
MQRLRAHFTAWALLLIGPVMMISPLVNPDLDRPIFAVSFGLVTTLCGAVMVRALLRSQGSRHAQSGSGLAAEASGAVVGGSEHELRWSTNAPPMWPPLVTSGDVPASPAPVLTLRTAAAFKRAVEEDGLPFTLSAMAPSYLLEDGLLEVSFEVIAGDRRVPVQVYPEAGEEASAHFAALRRALAARGFDSVYYAPGVLRASADPRPDVVGMLGFDALTPCERDIRSGDHSMWWPTEEDSDAPKSPVLADIDRFYGAVDGREAWFVGFLLHGLGVLEEARPEPPPEELGVFNVTGPEGQTLLVSLSAEKGLRFHFHRSQDPTYRDRFWRHIAAFAVHFRGQLDRQGVPEAEATRERPAEWWRLTRGVLATLGEKGQAPRGVGTIPI